jgi:hypothetical protein
MGLFIPFWDGMEETAGEFEAMSGGQQSGGKRHIP